MESREQINAVWQMQNYIEEHLDEPITLHALAKSACYSPWHCARIFKELTGKAPFEYIRMYRLSKAAMELRDNNLKVVDVAMDFLFDSHEGFTRAFRRQFGMSPNEYKKNTPPIYLFHPWSIREYYYWLRDMQEDAQGVELPENYGGAIPEGFDLIDLPECKMMMFQSAPYDDLHFEEAILNLSQIIDTYDPSGSGYEWADEAAPRFQLDPQGWRGYIEARPVRELP